MVKSLIIKKSSKPGKKLMAMFIKPGYLSFYILWGDSTSRQQNIKAYKKRFSFT